MASFAQLDENNKVLNIIKISDEDIIDGSGIENEELGVQKCKEILGEDTRWVQTWYGENPKRVRNAQVGGIYVEEIDAFLPPKTFQSWVLNSDSASWVCPKPAPSDIPFGYGAHWDEQVVDWVVGKVNDPENTLPQPEEPAPDGQEYFWNHTTWAWDTRDKPAEEVVVDVESEEVGDTPALDAGA